MRITATNPFDASKQILRLIAASDIKYSRNSSRYGYLFVYFSLERCRFSFEPDQRRDPKELIGRFHSVDIDEVVHVAACKHAFVQIVVAGIIARKIMSPIDFFKIAKDHPDWI